MQFRHLRPGFTRAITGKIDRNRMGDDGSGSVQMSIEQDSMERFREGVRCVDSGIYPLKLDEVADNPLLDCKMMDIHVTSALR
jgi:hypothetical protein